MQQFGIYTRNANSKKYHVCDIVVKSAAHAVNQAQIKLGKQSDYFILPRASIMPNSMNMGRKIGY